MTSLTVISVMVLAGTSMSQTAQTQPAQTRPAGLPNPFFAMDTATRDANHQSYESQVKMIKELGYTGWGPSAKENVPEMLRVLDAQGLKMFAIYVMSNVDPDQPRFDAQINETIAALKGRDTVIWLCMKGTKYQPASREGDERAVAIIDEIAEMAEKAGLRVALYPHVDFYLARVEDAVRLIGKIRHRNVGVTFNLCHWLKTDRQKDPTAVLKLARPHLMLVSVNGADFEGGWDRLIQPLGRGGFDVYGLLKTLRKMGYDGPIGFQGYGIKGDVRENLRETMEAWRSYSKRLTEEGP